MGRKRKSDATRLDEVDRGMYTAFCGAANSLSQLYSQAMNRQRLLFHAGERHGLEKLYAWILRQQENGVRVMPSDVGTYIQACIFGIRIANELDCGTEDPPLSPRLPVPQQLTPHAAMQSTHLGIPISSNSSGPATVVQAPRSGNSDQTKTSVFSNALSSPVRCSLQHYQLSQGINNSDQTRDPNPPSSNDTLMDMHPDSPGHDSPC